MSPLPKPDDLDDLRSVSVATAATLLEVSIQTIYRLLERGEIRFWFVGCHRKRRISIAALREFKARQERDELAPRRPRQRA